MRSVRTLSRGIRSGLFRLGAAAIALAERGPSRLSGDRDVEWSWVVSRMGRGPGNALDFGCGDGNMGLVAARCGYQVTAIDLLHRRWPYRVPGLTFVQGDLLAMDLAPQHYDLIVNCSSIEHVGLSGRYGSAERPDGDLDAMSRLSDLARPGARMVMTIPVGQDAVFAPLHRVYGPQRLPRLLAGWTVEDQEFWVEQADGRWAQVERSEALSLPPKAMSYGVGLFVLRQGAS